MNTGSLEPSDAPDAVWRALQAWNASHRLASEVQSPSKRANLLVEEDDSMKLASGAMVCIVQWRLMKIPKATLQLHCGGLASMISSAHADDETLPLDDTIEEFEAFHTALMNPFDSCLEPGTPSSGDLSTILNVLKLSHKYDSPAYKQRALARAFEPATPDGVDKRLYPLILEVATFINSAELGRVTQDYVIKQLWNSPGAVDVAKIALEFGEKINNPLITATAYYCLMLAGPGIWRIDQSLRDDQKERLIQGALAAPEKWVDMCDGLVRIACPCQQDDCPTAMIDIHREAVFHQAKGRSRIPSFDVIGRIKSMISACDRVEARSETMQRHHSKCVQHARRVLAETEKQFKDSVWELFNPRHDAGNPSD